MIKHYCSSIPSLNANFCVLVSNEDRESLVKYITNEAKITLDDDLINNHLRSLDVDGMYITVTFEDGSVDHLIVLIEHGSPGLVKTLIHEAQHCCFEILFDRGIKHTVETDEIYSYTLAHIVDTALQNVKSFESEVANDRNKARHRLVSKDNSSGKRRNTRKGNK